MRTVWVYAIGLLVTPFLAIQAIVTPFFSAKKVHCRCTRIAHRWGRILMGATGSTVEVRGLENFDPDRPHLLVANHQSWFDVFALIGWVPGNFRFVAKKELEKIPIFGWSWRRCGHVSIDRQDRTAAIASLKAAAEKIARENLTIVMFPEGTRSSDGRLQPFKKGAFMLGIQSGVPLIPVAIKGTRDIMPKGGWTIGKGRVTIRLGRPIDTTGYEVGDRDRLRDDAHRALAGLLGEPGAPEELAGQPATHTTTPIEEAEGPDAGDR